MSRQENDSSPLAEHEPQRVVWSRSVMCRARTSSLPACQAHRASRSLCASANSQSFSLRAACLAHSQRQSPRSRVLTHLDRHSDALDLERDGPRPLLAVRLHCVESLFTKMSRAECDTRMRRTLHEVARNAGLANNCGGYS